MLSITKVACFVFYFTFVSADIVNCPTHFPYHVSIKDSNGNHICSGCLVAEQWVMTAAHCVDSCNPYTVTVGTIDKSTGGTTVEIIDVIQHEEYDSECGKNDIALVKIIPVCLGPKVQVIYLPTHAVFMTTELTITGWNTDSDELHYFTSNVISHNRCKAKALPDIIFGSNMCSNTNDNKALSLAKDGGPLVSNDKVYGIGSWHKNSCDDENVFINTSVSKFRKWILKIIKSC